MVRVCQCFFSGGPRRSAPEFLHPLGVALRRMQPHPPTFTHICRSLTNSMECVRGYQHYFLSAFVHPVPRTVRLAMSCTRTLVGGRPCALHSQYPRPSVTVGSSFRIPFPFLPQKFASSECLEVTVDRQYRKKKRQGCAGSRAHCSAKGPLDNKGSVVGRFHIMEQQ